ncbi:MAG: DUF885 domain-containing protein [Actinocatenispora sp.]
MADSAATLIDRAWDRILAGDPVTALRLGRQVEALPRGGADTTTQRVTEARADLARWARTRPDDDTGDDTGDRTEEGPGDGSGDGSGDRHAGAFVRDHLAQEVAEAERFWFRFPVTPYNVMVLADYRDDVLGRLPLVDAADVARYLGLLDDYVGVVREMRATVEQQRRRGIRLPGWAMSAALDAVRGQADSTAGLVPGADRSASLAPGPAGRLRDGATRTVRDDLPAAFDALLAEIGAGDGASGVGIGQYPGGAECYDGLIRLHTGLDLAADEVHRIGLSEVDRLTDVIRAELGIADEAGHRRALLADPRTYAGSPAELEATFRRHVDRLGDMVSRYFGPLPAAPFRLRRLPSALEGGMTYGYYEPVAADGCGYYHYNGSDLAHRPLAQAASIIYHEGLPGHHLQLGRQRENTGLHPVRREFTMLRTFATNGFLEGWAEYAAGYCDVLGLYADPFDRYGRLSSERFHAARLVVDTGLNVLGWSRERAADFLRTNGFLSDGEIGTELVRYAVDDPGQALGYHLGHWELRRLGAGADPLAFHTAVLDVGPLPLRLLGDAVAAHREAAQQPRSAPNDA